MIKCFARSAVVLAIASGSMALADGPAHPLPISAHNCYGEDQADNPRFREALALGIDNIEIDLGWDDTRRQLIIGHDQTPRPGVAYPTVEGWLIPTLESLGTSSGATTTPSVLTIDWKTDHPEAVRQFKEVLDSHAEWFSSAPKAADSPLTRRQITICFSGSDAAKEAYDAMIPEGGTYRAFRDRVIGAGAGYEPDVSAYIPQPATSYHRFLAFYWGAIEKGGPPAAGEWTPAEADRLASLMDLAHRQGFRVRFYSLNGHTGPRLGSYRFANDDAAKVRWLAAASAGVDWIAGDEYREMATALGSFLNPGPAVLITQDSEIPAFAREKPEFKSGEPIFKFNGKDLTGFYPYTKTHAYEDPQKIFSVVDGAIKVSGEDYGGLATGGNFSNYHLVVEWKWGEKTFGNRLKASRDSGILLHCVGPDGVASGSWMESIECQIIEGGVGDFIMVGGQHQPKMTAETRLGPDGQPYFDKGSPAVAYDKKRINWWGRDPAWKDVLGFRGKRDVEAPLGEWNLTEVICDGGRITVLVNGLVVNKGTDASHTQGKIQFQSEGAELYFRKIEVRPLIRP
ncbi:family 16 glycoside hydrolase [Tundrisphaera lichenicola]|uniref:family 16 glycoside hydrolase n=1 Tax=Tundrisphaera lichenicola TaxID=2029860 RepID=UPI003EB8F39E